MNRSKISPYASLNEELWISKTEELIKQHPLSEKEIVQLCLDSWENIFSSRIGNLQIGKNFFPSPQIVGALLHALIPANIEARFENWQGEKNKYDKDIVYIKDDYYSIELKTSSDSKYIFGNRSYAQPQDGITGKSKNGYYLTINFEKFMPDLKLRPEIKIIRFGWLDHTDWIAQTAATGQQARLSPEAYRSKLKILYQK
ncbi:TPA: ScaI family restriction endonuclease [Neisseria meningitidis]